MTQDRPEPTRPPIVPVPSYETEEQEPPEVKQTDELADLFEVPQPDDNDMAIDHLFEIEEEDDMSDLVDVSGEDIMGEAPKPKRKFRIMPKGRRFNRDYPPTIGGMRY